MRHFNSSKLQRVYSVVQRLCSFERTSPKTDSYELPSTHGLPI